MKDRLLDADRLDVAASPATMASALESAAALAERERVLRVLHAQAPELRARGITHLSLFGSMARGEAGAQSDVDLLIDLARDAPFGLFDLVDLRDQLAERLDRPVNVAFRSTLRAWMRAQLEKDRIEIF